MKTAQYNKKKIMAKKSTTREIAFGFAMIILTVAKRIWWALDMRRNIQNVGGFENQYWQIGELP